MVNTSKKIVIVGGGSFGINTARALTKKLDTSKYQLTVITPRPFYVHLPATIRAVVTAEEKLEDKILMPYGDALQGKGQIKTGKVVSFSEWKDGSGGKVVLEGGEEVPYDALILTPGSVWEGPLAFPDSEEDVLKHITEWRKKIEAADSYLLVGGGAVGIEFAGELRHYFPSKPTTLVHAQQQLLNAAYPDKFRKRVLSSLEKTGTKVIFGDYIDELKANAAGVVATRSGAEVKASLVIPARGGRPNTESVKVSLGDGVLTPSGHIKVEPTLQVQGHSHIFAGGDVIDWNEQHQAGKGPAHAAILAQNVIAVLETGKAPAVYKGTFEMIVVTTGKTGGAGYLGVLWGIVLGDWLSKVIKSGGLMIEMTRGMMGLGKKQ